MIRHAAPYPVDDGPPIIRHRALRGRHAGAHEARRVRPINIAALVVAVAVVPAAWWAALTGVGQPTADRPAQHAPPGATHRPRVVLPPIVASPGPADSSWTAGGGAEPTGDAGGTGGSLQGGPTDTMLSPLAAPAPTPAPTPGEATTSICPASPAAPTTSTSSRGRAGQPHPTPTRSHP